jgi:hypothetical protein
MATRRPLLQYEFHGMGLQSNWSARGLRTEIHTMKVERSDTFSVRIS